jgi:DNA-binding NarL/FixJ family response regulator
LEFLEKSSAHMVVLDLSMPNLGGFAASRLVKQDYPDLKILILTIHKHKEYVEEAIASGAEGYLLKDEMDEELLPAITALRKGGRFISAQLSD